ncbi:MAG TPA: hypothetical protein VI259_18335 [Gemmatimonadaceae bacterium]
MDTYHIALFLHVVTLIVAASATAVTKLAVGRRIRAGTVADALDWHNVLVSTSRVFPICLASFVITGAYMVSFGGKHAWANGFVISGLVGVTFLLASGTYLGMKGRALKHVLEAIAAQGADRPAPRMAPPRLVALLPVANTGVALGVVFDMVTKPASIPVAIGAMALGAAISVGLSRRKPAAAIPPGVVKQGA